MNVAALLFNVIYDEVSKIVVVPKMCPKIRGCAFIKLHHNKTVVVGLRSYSIILRKAIAGEAWSKCPQNGILFKVPRSARVVQNVRS